MSRKSPFIAEIAIGLAISGLVGWAYLTRWYPIESFSLKTFDIFSRINKTTPKIGEIQIVGIDEESVSQLGRFPWPRPMIGQLVDEVAARGAKVIGLNIAFLEPDQNLGLEQLSSLTESFTKILGTYKNQLKAKRISASGLNEFLTQMEEAKESLDGDTALAQSIEQSGTLVVPMEFKPGEPLGENLEKLPPYIEREKLSLAGPDQTFPFVPSAEGASLPIEPVGKVSLAIGFNNLFRDLDGSIRRVTPVMRYGKDFYPSFGIQVAREYLSLQREAMKWNPEEGFQLLKARIPIDEEGQTLVKFSPGGTFKYHSALDVFTGAVPENAFDKKIVLIGVTLSGYAEVFVTPGGEPMTGLEIWANHLENILNQNFIIRPDWADKAEWLAIFLAALLVILALPLLRARFAIPISALILALLIGASLFLFVKKGMWVSPTYGIFLLASGFMVLVGKRYVFTERGKEMVEAEGVETNKMLGLSFQGQGMLDLAFEKFRKCPLDNQMKDLLYNLGLDMERKRQFAKAAAVYEHISGVDPKYKDILDKISLLKKAGEGAVFGGVGKKGSEATVVVDGLGQNTTLGRYEVMKELGRGAMGIVYLGRDPKINRQVAIKTLRFEDEVSEEQMKSIKERFFREAESAGNLTHPNIIRIFDAGEDQDVAYIAMELLEGHDLKAVCEKGNLLPIPRVLEITATVAGAIDYAHKQGVVHRDIKPANIMLLKDNTLRITDFGIARIQTSSKTATGAVLGTPAYMSPEQVNGQKADGRSDIYSLGVTLYELLTGEKPFQADTIAALLYRIANVDHPDPREYNAKIPASVVEVLKKALAKKPEERYQTGADMAQDLQNCLKEFSKETPKPADKKVQDIPVEKKGTKKPDTNPNNEFLSELQETFNIKNEPENLNEGHLIIEPNQLKSEEVARPKPANKIPPPPTGTKDNPAPGNIEKTLPLIEKTEKTIIERTVIEPPQNLKPEDIPTLTNIEHNYDPGNAKNDEDDDKPSKNLEL